MANFSKDDYMASIEESAATISKELGNIVVQTIYQRYGANCIEGLKTSHLPDVFSEIYAM